MGDNTQDLSVQFGRLSTKAAEWIPASSTSSPPTKPKQTATQSQYASDLSATQVKEFVPGRGWAATTNATTAISTTRTAATTGHASQIPAPHQQQQTTSMGSYGNETDLGPSTFPAGPTPSPFPSFRAIHSLGTSEEQWSYYREMALESIRQMEPTDQRHKEILPPYCNAYCLDNEQKGRQRSSFGYLCKTFQVTSREDGHLYCVHRFDDVRSVSPKIAAAVLERWVQEAVQEHPGIVPLYQCYVAQRAVFFVHQYIPLAHTLAERLGAPLSENVLWSCIVQLVSAISAVHRSNLAVRSIDMSHVLAVPDATNSRLRVRLNCVGVVDALEFEARRHVNDLQKQDIRDLGWLLLSLATGTEVNAKSDRNTVSQCENFLAQNFSRELQNLTMTLIKSAPHPPSIVDVSRAIALRAFQENEATYRSMDLMERQLSSEYESGRCLRLLLKLGFINERPEFGQDRRWSQSGDCYVLTLFRDFVFHQADGSGFPVMDLGHVMTVLNKLDAADEEEIVLTSRDGKSMMVVTYADVARCLENAYGELCSHNVPAASLQY